jgi:hypothetical protein
VFASQFSSNFVDSVSNAELVGKFGNVLHEAKIAEFLPVSVEEIECGMHLLKSECKHIYCLAKSHLDFSPIIIMRCFLAKCFHQCLSIVLCHRF